MLGLEGPSTRAIVEVLQRFKETLDQQRGRDPDELSLLQVAVGLSSYPLDGDTTRALILAAHERLEMAVERDPNALVWR